MEQQKSRKKGFSGEVCPKTRALKGQLWNSELITAGFLAQVKLAGIWGAALPWSSSIHSTLTGYRIPNPGGWQMGISSNSLHWDHIGMGNEGLFVNGNIRLFPMLGSHWNGKWRVTFQVQQTLSRDFCIPVNPKCLPTVSAWKGDICYNPLFLKSQEFFLCLWNATFQSCKCRSRDPGWKWGTWSWEKRLDPCVLLPGLNTDIPPLILVPLRDLLLSLLSLFNLSLW